MIGDKNEVSPAQDAAHVQQAAEAEAPPAAEAAREDPPAAPNGQADPDPENPGQAGDIEKEEGPSLFSLTNIGILLGITIVVAATWCFCFRKTPLQKLDDRMKTLEEQFEKDKEALLPCVLEELKNEIAAFQTKLRRLHGDVSPETKPPKGKGQPEERGNQRTDTSATPDIVADTEKLTLAFDKLKERVIGELAAARKKFDILLGMSVQDLGPNGRLETERARVHATAAELQSETEEAKTELVAIQRELDTLIQRIWEQPPPEEMETNEIKKTELAQKVYSKQSELSKKCNALLVVAEEIVRFNEREKQLEVEKAKADAVNGR